MADRILDYTFKHTDAASSNGSFPFSFENATVADGPGAIAGENYPKAVDLGTTGKGVVDVGTLAADLQRFAIRVVFATNGPVTTRQNIVESNFVPFSLYLGPRDASGYDVVAAVAPKAHGWRSATTHFAAALAPGTWHVADLVYDIDTLGVFVDGTIVSVHAFPSGPIEKFASTKLFVGTWVDGAAHHFDGKIAALQWYAGVPDDLLAQLDERRSSPEWFMTHKLEALRPPLDLGEPTGPSVYDAPTDAYIQPYQNGDLIYHDGVGCAFEMHGAIRDLYRTLTNKSALGYLVSDESNSANSAGRRSVFAFGAIYWSGATGAVPVIDRIYLEYVAMGETRAIGFPTKRAAAVPGGFEQEFQGARMYYKTGASSAHEVHGLILAKYLALGGPPAFGFPVSNEGDLKKDQAVIGRFSDFERCTIYWTGAVGAFEAHGDIRAKYRDLGGPAGDLGFPTSDELNIPGASGRFNTFQKGSILWYGSWASIVVARPFKLFVGRIDTKESEGFAMGQNDLYVKIKVDDGGAVVYNGRTPSSGDLGGNNVVDLNLNLPPTITPNAAKTVTLTVDVWDSDPFSDDHLGTWTKALSPANAWGLKENSGILNSGSFSNINSIIASVKPVVNVNALSETQKFWGVSNRSTDDISWSDYSAAFYDVDSDPEFYDPTDWLDKLFYEAVVKNLAESGNCFGMSLEAIYARKGASPFSLPLDRFTAWETVREMVNTKHAYQVGAGPIWWFVGQFISGNTHDPKDVFTSTRNEAARGNNSVLCIAQNYDFSGKPHCILPVAWDDSSKPWKITICDPNLPGQLRTLTVNPDDNTFAYTGTATYTGGQWSGGRLHYMPWEVLCSRERTPIWDAILLLLAGTIIVLGSDAQTTAIVDANGIDIDGFGERAKTELQAGRALNDFFVPFNAYSRGLGQPVGPARDLHIVLAQARGKGAVSGEVLARMRQRNHEGVIGSSSVPPSVLTHLPIGELSANSGLRNLRDTIIGRADTSAVGDRTLLHLAADDSAMARLTPAARGAIAAVVGASRPGDYRHTTIGLRAGQFSYAAKHGLGQFLVETTVAQGETTEVAVTDIATNKQTVRLSTDRSKRVKLQIDNKLGISRDHVRVTLDQLPVEPGKELQLNLKPGLGGLEIVTNIPAASANVEIEAVIAGKSVRRQFDLPLDGGARVKLSTMLAQDSVAVSKIDQLFGPGREAKVIPARR